MYFYIIGLYGTKPLKISSHAPLAWMHWYLAWVILWTCFVQTESKRFKHGMAKHFNKFCRWKQVIQARWAIC